MPARRDDSARRTLVPAAAGRSLGLAAIWTGAGTAVVSGLIGIVAVSLLWLPASGPAGNATSAIKAGLLSFLAALHGGLTVDGTATGFVPLGLTLAVGRIAWRAGTSLADAAEALEADEPARLLRAAVTQLISFVVAALVLTGFAGLGTSHASFLGVGLGAVVVFALCGSTSFVLDTELRITLAEWLAGRRVGTWLARSWRPAVAAVATYLGCGAVLVSAALIAHHGDIEALSRQVGGGWAGLPILVLDVLAAPNAIIAGAAYLLGPGFAVGHGTTVSAFITTHGEVPAFPLLGALPRGSGADPAVWWFMAASAALAGAAAARAALREADWPSRLRSAFGGAILAGVIFAALAAAGGGAVGAGRLRAVGASAWQAGGALAGILLITPWLAFGAAAAWRWIDAETAPELRTLLGERDRADQPARRPLSVVTGRDENTDAGADTDEDSGHPPRTVRRRGRAAG